MILGLQELLLLLLLSLWSHWSWHHLLRHGHGWRCHLHHHAWVHHRHLHRHLHELLGVAHHGVLLVELLGWSEVRVVDGVLGLHLIDLLQSSHLLGDACLHILLALHQLLVRQWCLWHLGELLGTKRRHLDVGVVERRLLLLLHHHLLLEGRRLLLLAHHDVLRWELSRLGMLLT